MADNKKFGGPVILLDRSDINTDEIIPAKHLTEISKQALAPYLLEDLVLDGFDPGGEKLRQAKVVITRANFGCGSSREHAVWAFEINDINVVIASSFARIFRQNMFNCGILAIELSKEDLQTIFIMNKNLQTCKKGAYIIARIDVEKRLIYITTSITDDNAVPHEFRFNLNEYDQKLVSAGGWLAYADTNY